MDQVVINVTSSELFDKIMAGNEQVIVEIQKGVLANWSDKNLRPKIDEEVAKSLIPKLDSHIKKVVRETVADEVKYEELEPFIRQTTVKVINKIVDEELTVAIEKRVKELTDKVLKKVKLQK